MRSSASAYLTRPLALVLAFLLALTLVPLAAPGSAAAAPSARTTALACPDDAPSTAGFHDVPDDHTHANTIACLAWWGVARGRTDGSYAPNAAIDRAQMASFVANALDRADVHLPDSAVDHFTDDDGSVHEANIDRLAAAGVVQGTGDDRYAPGRPVTRAQMATFLGRAYDAAVGLPLPAGSDAFADDDGGTHETAIDAIATAGLTAGVTDGAYAPAEPVRRGQMATFLGRLLDLLVDEGRAAVPVAPALDCEREGYACAWSDVDETVAARTLTLLDAAAAMMDDDATIDETVAFLEDHDDVVVMHVDLGGITFRVGDGALAVVETAAAALLPDDDAASATAAAEQASAHTAAQMLNEPVGVSGTQRRALVLDPYGATASGTAIAQMFRDNEQYGTVDHLSGEGVSVQVMQRLDHYDAVHITTHANTNVLEGGLVSDSAIDYTYDEAGNLDGAAMKQSVPGAGVAPAGNDRLRWVFNADFFRHHYPAGLRDTVMYIGACQAARGDITAALASDNGTVLGWSQPVSMGHEYATSQAFWKLMVEDGITAETALAQVRDQGLGYEDPRAVDVIDSLRQGCDSCVFEQDTELRMHGGDNRIRDVVRARQQGARIVDGTQLELSGTIADGVPETVDALTIELDGLEHGLENQVEVRVLLDASPVPVTFSPADDGRVTEAGAAWNDWTISVTDIPTAFDARPGAQDRRHDFVVLVRFPDGAVSLDRASVDYTGLEEPDIAVRSVHPTLFHELDDGDVVAVEGTEGDGAADAAPLALDVTGVAADLVGEYTLRTQLSGSALASPVTWDDPLPSLSALPDRLHRLQRTLPLGQDLVDGADELTIDVSLWRDGAEEDRHGVTIRLEGREEGDAEVEWAGNYRHYEGPSGNMSWVDYPTSGARTSRCDANPAIVLHEDSPTGGVREVTLGFDDVSLVIGPSDGAEVAIRGGETGTFPVRMAIDVPAAWEMDTVNASSHVGFSGAGQVTITRNEVRWGELGGGTFGAVESLEGTFTAVIDQERIPEQYQGAVEVSGSFAYDVDACGPQSYLPGS